MSCKTAARTSEIGLRLALGATRGQVRRLVLRQAFIPVLAGATFGLTASVVLGRTIENLLFQVRGTDPLTIGAAAALLVGVALLASWIPAYRASRKDPLAALRHE